jgi:hypothetical protein
MKATAPSTLKTANKGSLNSATLSTKKLPGSSGEKGNFNTSEAHEPVNDED